MAVEIATARKMPKPSRSRILRRQAPRRRANGPPPSVSTASSVSMIATFGQFDLLVGRAVAGFLDGAPNALRQLRTRSHHRMRQDQEIRFLDDGDRQLLQLRRQRSMHQAMGIAAADRSGG